MMTQNITDDRPIRPDKQYLKKRLQQQKIRKQHHDYLKKHQVRDQVLPCFRQNFIHFQKRNIQIQGQKKSKAQIYQEIKQKNLQKFGQKKKQKQGIQKIITATKKIDPKKMTIQYRAKQAIFIDTNEYKLKQKQAFQPGCPSNKNLSHKKIETQQKMYEQTAKQKYEKLLQVLRDQKMGLTRQKQIFEKDRQRLQFKKMISSQNQIPFLSQIQKSIRLKKQHQKGHRVVVCKNNQQNQQYLEEQRPRKSRNTKFQTGKRYKQAQGQNLFQVQEKIKALQQQKQQIQVQVYRSRNNLMFNDDVICTKYSIQQVSQIPTFDVECFKQFIDLMTLHPHGNQFYQIALKVFETGLNIKQAKTRLIVENLDRQDGQNSEKGLDSVDFKRRFQGQTRITKYNNGWIEVWTPGTQRLMCNKQLCYKVVWLGNGDIRQQWKDKKIESQYSKDKQVVKISFGGTQPIYFFTKLNQLQQFSNDKKTKDVMFKDGRVQNFSAEDGLLGGFIA